MALTHKLHMGEEIGRKKDFQVGVEEDVLNSHNTLLEIKETNTRFVSPLPRAVFSLCSPLKPTPLKCGAGKPKSWH